MKKLFALLLIVTTLCLSSIPIYADDEIEVVNNVGMGNVSISLRSEQLDKTTGKLVPIDNTRIVLPGERVSQVVTIVNEAEPAWIRVKLDFSTMADVMFAENLVSIVSGWIKGTDGYWYWPKVVGSGEEVQFMSGLTIPTTWDSAVAENGFDVLISADAVQSRNFTPDFKSDDPWFGTVIETSIYNYTRESHQTHLNFSVSYEGGAEGFVKVGDDFFSNWDTLMPGDVLTGEVKVKNAYRQWIFLYFRTENVLPTELEKAIKLKIYNGSEKIFDGTLNDSLKEILLGEINKGTELTLTYTIEVPAELNNAYSLTDGQVKWIFRAKLSNRGMTNPINTGFGNRTILCAGVLALATTILLARKKRYN